MVYFFCEQISACRIYFVAFLAEGVDRNYLVIDRNAKGQRRPPRGGRG